MTGGVTGEGDEGDVEFRNARMYARAFLTKCDNSWGGIMQVVPEAGCSVRIIIAMHSTAETMTAVSAIYRPASGRLP